MKELPKIFSYKILLLITILGSILLINRHSTYNWDMLGYMGVVFEYENNSIEIVHDKVYNTIKKQLPDSTYQLLISGEYRSKCLKDSSFFNKELSFYRVKPLYTFIVFILFKMGVPLTQATIIPSIIFYTIFCFLFFNWIKKEVKNEVVVVFSTIAIIIFAPLLSIAKLSSPDILSNLLLFILLYVFYYNKKIITMLSISLLAILARIDNIIFIFFLFTIYFYPTFKFNALKSLLINNKKPFIVITITGFLLFFLLSKTLGNSIEWISMFGHTKSIKDYLTHIVRIPGDFVKTFFPLILFFTLLLKNYLSKKMNQLIELILTTICVRLIAFPSFQERFFVTFEIIFILFIIIGFSKNTNKLVNKKLITKLGF